MGQNASNKYQLIILSHPFLSLVQFYNTETVNQVKNPIFSKLILSSMFLPIESLYYLQIIVLTPVNHPWEMIADYVDVVAGAFWLAPSAGKSG